jgi:hypothetical protein
VQKKLKIKKKLVFKHNNAAFEGAVKFSGQVIHMPL